MSDPQAPPRRKRSQPPPRPEPIAAARPTPPQHRRPPPARAPPPRAAPRLAHAHTDAGLDVLVVARQPKSPPPRRAAPVRSMTVSGRPTPQHTAPQTHPTPRPRVATVSGPPQVQPRAAARRTMLHRDDGHVDEDDSAGNGQPAPTQPTPRQRPGPPPVRRPSLRNRNPPPPPPGTASPDAAPRAVPPRPTHRQPPPAAPISRPLPPAQPSPLPERRAPAPQAPTARRRPPPPTEPQQPIAAESAITMRRRAVPRMARAKSVFGSMDIPLPDSIPLVFRKSIEFLQQPAHLGEEGLFRIPGSKSAIQRLDSRLRRGEDVCFSSIREPTLITGLIKLHLSRTPQLLMQQRFAEELSKAAKTEEEPMRLEAVRTALHAVPEPGVHLLVALIRLFAKVAMFDGNKMTPANLAGSTCLSMFPSLSSRASSVVVQYLIEHIDELWDQHDG